jgi:hypothetical protein
VKDNNIFIHQLTYNTVNKTEKDIHDFIDSVKFLNESSTKRANIMKIRLTKEQLYRVINESVKQVLSELNWEKYANTERLKRLKRLLN